MRFLFAVKASRFLTHMKKLKDPEEPLDRLFTRMQPLASHLGPVLYQLPPGWKLDISRLEHFLQALPKGIRHVLEFRDPSWYCRRSVPIAGTASCVSVPPRHERLRYRHGARRPSVYVRFHGAGGTYTGAYPEDRLAKWAEWLNEQRRNGAEVYAYFNNDVGGHAPRDAVTLRRLLEVTE